MFSFQGVSLCPVTRNLRRTRRKTKQATVEAKPRKSGSEGSGGNEAESVEEGSKGEGLNPRGKASDVESRCEANHKAVKGRAAELSTESGAKRTKGTERGRRGAERRRKTKRRTEPRGEGKRGGQSGSPCEAEG